MPTAEELAAEEAKRKADADALAAAEAKKNAEHMIPKSRLDEEIGKRKAIEDKLAAAEKANREAEEARLKEQNDYKALYDKAQKDLAELQPKAATADDAEKTLKSVLDAQVAELPESVRGMVPEELTTQQKLTWLAKNKALLMKPKAPDISAGKKGGEPPPTAVELTPDELSLAKRAGMTPEEYAKYKDKE